jgi:hypothetical protein
MCKGLFGAIFLAFSLIYCLAATGSASADTLLWRFESKHPNVVSVKLYSDSRRGHVWPNSSEVYVLDDYSVKTINISCRSGEKVCYGAWVRNRSNLYWGVGYENRNRCSNCCYTCNGGQTRVIVLNP